VEAGGENQKKTSHKACRGRAQLERGNCTRNQKLIGKTKAASSNSENVEREGEKKRQKKKNNEVLYFFRSLTTVTTTPLKRGEGSRKPNKESLKPEKDLFPFGKTGIQLPFVRAWFFGLTPREAAMDHRIGW